MYAQFRNINIRRRNISWRRPVSLMLSTGVLGLAAGLSSGLLALLLKFVENLFLNFNETPILPGPFTTPWFWRATSVTVGGIIAALVWWLLRNRTTSVPSVSQAVQDKTMPVWQTVVHVSTQIFLVGTGASIGREVAPREAGAMLAGIWMRLYKRLNLDAEDRRLLVAAAAGAGFAGIYISPLTGALFSIEILLKKINTTTVAVSFSMSVIAAAVGGAIHGFGPYYNVGTELFQQQLLIFGLIAAPIIGYLGGWFAKATAWAERYKTTNIHILWQLPLAAALTGLVSIWAPEVMGNGRALAQIAMNASSANGILLIVLIGGFKALLTILTIRSGASGGTLTPSIAVGASVGVALGSLWNLAMPAIPLWQCAIVGAVALLSASQQAPLMALMMLMEISHLPITAIGPLGLATCLGVIASRLVLSSTITGDSQPTPASLLSKTDVALR
ncbi:chloride channel protein [Bifidobacterium sp.]|uniref:chloride channel protein n=1 Tax=Bifidobacterium sp. TaxID=41200 RepID=UPI0025BDDEAE|nr:chloride channel protein [Bifidobacterium sp.]MCI1634903.1 chloride channel protein [Bifidobacterium sp.]